MEVAQFGIAVRILRLNQLDAERLRAFRGA